ncbi:DMT family transporter [Ascidiaceihabitans sp.]|uniref:DMT family transporter n=1 Tax=Ascidiaceihabitans sp. TaxID=1872644 RepID=UPI003298CE7F
MDLWIYVTLAAATFQTVRFMLQKQMATSTLSASGATFARFFYSAPLVAVLMALYLTARGQSFPDLSTAFWMYGAVGGLAQILATVCVVMLFKQRNFAVGITFKKSEVVLIVVMSVLVLGEKVTWLGFGAILLGVVGLLLLSSAPKDQAFRLRDMANKAAGLGLLSGALFAVSGVTYRGASLELPLDDPLARAVITLSAVTAMQLAAMAVWLRFREVGQITAVWKARRVAGWIGMFSMAGSFCWFLAFTLQNAAYVKALGQVELILSLVVTALFFKEKITSREITGVCILGASVVLLVSVI